MVDHQIGCAALAELAQTTFNAVQPAKPEYVHGTGGAQIRWALAR